MLTKAEKKKSYVVWYVPKSKTVHLNQGSEKNVLESGKFYVFVTIKKKKNVNNIIYFFLHEILFEKCKWTIQQFWLCNLIYIIILIFWDQWYFCQNSPSLPWYNKQEYFQSLTLDAIKTVRGRSGKLINIVQERWSGDSN